MAERGELVSRALLTATLLALVVTSCGGNRLEREAASYDASSANDWMTLSTELVEQEGLTPPLGARVYGYVALAIHEAVAPGMARHASLSGVVPDLEAPDPPDGPVRWPYAAAVAASETLKALIPGAADAFARPTDGGPDTAGAGAEEIARTEAWGEAIAEAILRRAADDGYEATHRRNWTPPSAPGRWIPTPPSFAPAVAPFWGELKPMALQAADACPTRDPAAYSEDPSSDFYREALAVYRASQIVTPKTRSDADYWADLPGLSATPGGHWVRIAVTLTNDADLDLEEAARLHAAVGVAVNDAFIAAWRDKYESNVVRPVTYIRARIDPDWASLLDTPPFPEYPSGHSVGSAAAATVLEALVGTRAFTDGGASAVAGSTAKWLPETRDGESEPSERTTQPPRTYRSVSEAATEAAWSRLHGGIHYPMGIQAGLDQGRCVGEAALRMFAPEA